MKNMRTHLVLVGKFMTGVVFLIAVMGVFSNSYAKDKFGRLKYNPEVIPKFASSAPA